MNKKKWIVRLFITLLLVCALYLEMSAWAPFRVNLRSVQLESEVIPQSFDNASIAVISDIYGNTDNLIKARKHYEKLQPEFLVFTGNLYEEVPEEETLNQIKELLSSMEAPMGKFAILSPNDNETTRSILVESGFTVLSNSSIELHNGKEEYIRANFYDSVTPSNFAKQEGVYTLGFAYDANTFETVKVDTMDLFIGSKTLGGAINIPFIGSLSFEGITKKKQEIDGIQVLVNQGIGTHEPQIRLLSSPELLLINFKVKSNEP